MMKRLRIVLELPMLCLLLTGVLSIGAHTIGWPTPGEAPVPAAIVAVDRPLEESVRLSMATYCTSCHQSGRSGVDFTDESMDLMTMRHNRSDWEQVTRKLQDREMPPSFAPQPTDQERAEMIAWIDQEVLQYRDAGASGHLIARRLQRSEYINIVRELLGVRFEPSADFPKDESEWTRRAIDPELTPRLASQYRATADQLLDDALALERVDGCNGSKKIPLFTCGDADRTPSENARAIFTEFTRRALRRPADPAEVDRLMSLFEDAEKEGKTFEESVKIGLADILTSPRFLYRIEPRDAHKDADPYALASRLSFFLWRTTPDDELLALAEEGVLEEHIEEQVARMLQDPRARALAIDFADWWLGLGSLDAAPNLDPALAQAMREETEHFAAAILAEDRSVLEFLDADYTYVNERLAANYGIPGIYGDHMRRIDTKGTPRGGLLTHASILRITSPGSRTSPVNRGKWVLENLLGAAPIRPPAGLLQTLATERPNIGPGTSREQAAMHRANPNCAQCHIKMDAIGLSLEHFDVHGAWQTEAVGRPVDAVGELEDGETLDGLPALKAYLTKHRRQFVRTLSEKLLRFALGRKLDPRDRAALDAIPHSAARQGNRFSHIILQVVQSEPFRQGFTKPSGEN